MATGELGGGHGSARQVLRLADNQVAPGGHSLRYSDGNGDLVMRYSDLDAWEPFRITGPGTTSPVGPHRLAVNALGLGWWSKARLLG